MHYNTIRDLSFRVAHMFSRVTINEANANPKWQELSIDGMNNDKRQNVEFVQGYGFVATVLPRDKEEGKQSGQSTSGGTQPEKPKGPAAEGIAVFMGGQRNHPVIIAVDDRRHRPRGLKPGESAQYDDQGQMTLIKRDGMFFVSPKTISIRNATKEKQPEGEAGNDFKHEAEDGNVTAEIRVTDGKIQFLIGGQILGEVTAQGFCIGGSMDDDQKREVFRYKDIDDGGNTPVKYAKKAFGI